jgi:flagellar biosynthesis/type III secretory pathway protein FliH
LVAKKPDEDYGEVEYIDSYTEGYREGYVKGFDEGVCDGRYQGYRDAKTRAFRALDYDDDMKLELEKALGEE